MPMVLRNEAASGTAGMTSMACSIVLFVGLWYGFSAALSILNKGLVGKENANFNMPLLLSCVHSCVHCIISTFVVKVVGKQKVGVGGWSRSSIWNYIKMAGPTALCTALDIGLSNSSLHYISLSFYTMIKSSVPVWVLIFAFMFRLEEVRLSLVAIIFVICFGVVFTIAGELRFNLTGFLMVLSAAAFSGLRWNLTQILLSSPHNSTSVSRVASTLPRFTTSATPSSIHSVAGTPVLKHISIKTDTNLLTTASDILELSNLKRTPTSSTTPSGAQFYIESGATSRVHTPPPLSQPSMAGAQATQPQQNHHKKGPITTLYELSPLMVMLLATGSLLTEREAFATSAHWETLDRALQMSGNLVAGGVLALCMTLAEFYLIANTNVVTLSVAGIFKEVFMIALSMVIFGDQLTGMTWLGVGISIAGIAAYTLYKLDRMGSLSKLSGPYRKLESEED